LTERLQQKSFKNVLSAHVFEGPLGEGEIKQKLLHEKASKRENKQLIS